MIILAVMIFLEILSLYGRPMKPTIAHNANPLNENYKISSVTPVSRKIDVLQKIADKGEVRLPSTPVQSLGPDDSAAVYVDDFHPTKQGNKKDFKPNEIDGGDRHIVAASSNDFRPTEPGHSPGVGHSFKD
ncbi:hypothetical protein BT93_I0562 [Corymbia citriodora subsp. variegata]|nr:hypothetical protein BT93_I0562 [Corymbia citriodora subsp. variegata]